MNWVVIGFSADTLGKILLGFTVLKVYWHVLREHKVDADVLRQMRQEQVLGTLGIGLIIVGYLLQLPSNF
ncbi:MAG: hypothetical protein ACE5GQ_09760 [Nitrospinales bacterium]